MISTILTSLLTIHSAFLLQLLQFPGLKFLFVSRLIAYIDVLKSLLYREYYLIGVLMSLTSYSNLCGSFGLGLVGWLVSSLWVNIFVPLVHR